MKKSNLSTYALAAMLSTSTAFTTISKLDETVETKYRAYAIGASDLSCSAVVSRYPALNNMPWQATPITYANLITFTLDHFDESAITDICDGDNDFYCTIVIQALVNDQTVVTCESINEILFGSVVE